MHRIPESPSLARWRGSAVRVGRWADGSCCGIIDSLSSGMPNEVAVFDLLFPNHFCFVLDVSAGKSRTG